METKVWGVLAGGALGDAMGMPTECWSLEKINRIHPNGVNELLPSDVSDTYGRNLVAGSITDDTINVLMILKMIIKNQGRISVDDYIAELVDWNNNSGISEFVSGPSTLNALAQIAKGVPLEKTGISGTTNGASMKIAPIGLVSDYRDLPTLVKNVHQICLPTHNSTIAIQGASAVAAAISYVLQGGNSIEAIWQVGYEAIEVATDFGYDFPAASLKFRMTAAQKIVNEETDKEKVIARLYHEIGTGMETIETIPSVFAIIQLAQGDALEAAKLSAQVGWDTDTIGAISCSICGGMNPNLPIDMIKQIEAANDLDFTQLTKDILPFVLENQATIK